jgi:peptide deformylase
MLRKRAVEVTRLSAPVNATIERMVVTMFAADGIGLAANQIGLLQRIIVINPSEDEEDENPNRDALVLINPVVTASEGRLRMKEGCLSLPDIREDVSRAARIRVEYLDISLARQSIDAEGIIGRVLLHEIDHLDGVLFVDHLSLARRAILRPRLRKISKGQCETSYPVIVGTSAAKGRANSQRKKRE